MSHSTCTFATAYGTMATTGVVPASNPQSNAVTSNRCSLRLEHVCLKSIQDARRNLHVEQRIGESRLPGLILSTSHSRGYRLGKNRRWVCVCSSRMNAVKKSNSTEANTSPYIVKDGDTLTSIAKKTKTSVRLLADTNKIDNVDFLLSGRLLQTPKNSEANEMPARPAIGGDEFPIPIVYGTKAKAVSSRELCSPLLEASHLAASVQPLHSFNFPKLVPILLIAPLLGFCIRCIADVFYVQMDREEAKEGAERVAWETVHTPKAQRWQKILEEDRDAVEIDPAEASTPTNAWAGGVVWTPDGNVQEKTLETVRNETDEEIGLKYNQEIRGEFGGDEGVRHKQDCGLESDEEINLSHKQDYEEIQKSYVELESVYVKFLADSGMSNLGYWRGGGVPTTAALDDGES